MAIVPNKYVFIKESNGNVTMETYKDTDLIGTASLNPAKDIRISESYPESIIIPFNTTGNHIDNKFVSIPWTKIDFVGSTPTNTAPTTINEAVALLGQDFFFELGGGGSGTNGISVIGGTLGLGGTLVEDTTIDTNGNTFIITSQGSLPNETVSFNFLPNISTGFASVLTDNAGVVSGPLFVINESQSAIVFTPDTNNDAEISLVADATGNTARGIDDLGTSSCFRARNDSDESLFQVMNNGVVLAQKVVNFNFADDAAAAAGDIPVGGIYHNAGALRIRLV